MRTIARQWLKNFDRPRPSTSIGFFFCGVFVFIWSSTITRTFGFDPYKDWGVAVFISFGLILAYTLILVNSLLSRLGLVRSLRSAFLFSALIGPFLAITTYNNSKIPVWGHLAGFGSALIAFCISLVVDQLTERKHPTNIDK